MTSNASKDSQGISKNNGKNLSYKSFLTVPKWLATKRLHWHAEGEPCRKHESWQEKGHKTSTQPS